ncbi:hypothetical protein [Paenibacillus zeirhizosphaerae]
MVLEELLASDCLILIGGVSKQRVPALMDGLNGPVESAFREEAENIGW